MNAMSMSEAARLAGVAEAVVVRAAERGELGWKRRGGQMATSAGWVRQWQNAQ